MLTKDLIYAFRNLGRNKLLAIINVLGLSIGISACLIILLMISYELSFDRFQPDRDSIYRIYTRFSGVFTGINRGVATGVPAYIREYFSGVDAVTNFHTFNTTVRVPVADGPHREFPRYNKIIIADAGYFEVFRYYDWIIGNPQQSLRAPFQVVLTESRAKTYFGDVDLQAIIGSEIRYQDSLTVTVSGIIADVDERTDLDFTDFISFGTIERSTLKKWILLDDFGNTNSNSQAFIRLTPGTTPDHIAAQMPAIRKKIDKVIDNVSWVTIPSLQPLREMHFNTEVGIFDGSRPVTDESTFQILGIVAVLLLLMAVVNFVNLETAQASRRAKEVGVRKVLGSSRTKLVTRFLAESFVLSTLAVLVSLAVMELAMRMLSDFMPEGLHLDITDPQLVVFLIVFITGVTLLAGTYPAFVLSSFQPARALKNTAGVTRGTRSGFVRKALTVFQFSFSQVLIMATLTIGFQLRYMLNKDLGFTQDGVINIRMPDGERSEKASLLGNAFNAIHEVDAVSVHGEPPASAAYSSSIMKYNDGKETVEHNVFLKFADTSYLSVYGIELLAGRNLQPVDSASEYLINETYAHSLGFASPRDAVGRTVNEKYLVAGVVRDFHTKTLHSALEPTAIKFVSHAPSIGVRLAINGMRVSDVVAAIGKMEAAWKKIFPEHPFEYRFMDDYLELLYVSEQRVEKLARVATVIAILISCLGLVGLSSFTVIQRTKEIGIRKVLGATVNNIMVLLSKDFLMLVILAFVLSAPLAYEVATWWLDGFAYKIQLGVWIFVVSGLLSVIIAFVTISFRTVHAAKADPVRALRYE